MRKIKLELDRLTVDSFGTSDADGGGRGTVRGASDFTRESCDNCSGLRPCELSYATNMQVACPCQDPGETGIVC